MSTRSLRLAVVEVLQRRAWDEYRATADFYMVGDDSPILYELTAAPSPTLTGDITMANKRKVTMFKCDNCNEVHSLTEKGQCWKCKIPTKMTDKDAK